MSTYAIGDLQGCFEAFQNLLGEIRFDPEQDRLWLVGDLVNRGPDSLAVLRWVKEMGDRVVTVLGNHDLHLIMVATGHAKEHRSDSIRDVLEAPDREELINWLRHQRMFHAENGYAMVHAGLLPQWSIAKAKALAGEVEQALRGDQYGELCAHMYGNFPHQWRDDLEGMGRMRVIINAMTRMRFVTPEGAMEFSHKGEPLEGPEEHIPWFEVPGRASADTTIICGHWSALGLRIEKNLVALDSGCLWGGHLSAIRLEDRAVYQVSCAGLAGTTHWQ
jgi:bis(5'-nucleosyl)-tetraphosphatase (symmetrical)